MFRFPLMAILIIFLGNSMLAQDFSKYSKENFVDGSATDLNINIGWMSPQTIYYAKEGVEGLSSHPLGDIFFLTSTGKYLVATLV